MYRNFLAGFDPLIHTTRLQNFSCNKFTKFLNINASFTKLVNYVANSFLEPIMLKHIAALIITSSIAAVSTLPAHSASSSYADSEKVIVTVDQAKVFRISRPAATIIIGNPSIVDATIEDEQTLVLTGRSFGVTNLIILDAKGDAVVDQAVVVRGSETNTVRIYRGGSNRETLAFGPVCEITVTIGDNPGTFESATEQITQRNALSEANSD
jgi:hypothetical protein